MAKFNNGDIVYWHRQDGNNHKVEFGMVNEQFSDAVCVDLLELKEYRLINGIPLDEFESDKKPKKLPKGWTYDTSLFDITYDMNKIRGLYYKIEEPSTIKDMYNEGFLVKADTKFHGKIDVEIDKDGYRIVKKYPMWEKPIITHASIRPDRLYFTYQEAQAEVDAYNTELQRISNLTDYEWSVEQIDKTLDKAYMYSDETKRKYKEWLLGMKNVEAIETRLYMGNIQWKYEDKKKWNNIEV